MNYLNKLKSKQIWSIFHYKRTNICNFCSKSSSPRKLPLHGITVLDMSRVLAGPFCTQLLGDHGADIIKIEQPIIGDQTRHWIPPITKQGNESVYYISCNRNKRSLTLNFKSKQGQDILHQLIAKSDILVENFIPSTLAQYSLDYEYIAENINPAIIYCSLTAFGSHGPYAHRAGYDVPVQAMGGLMYITGDEKPCKTGVALIDVISGLYAHSAILSALRSRDINDGGKYGQKIDVNLFDTCVTSLVNVASNYLMSGMEGGRWGTAHASVVPYQSFATKYDNEYIVIAGNDNVQFHRLCKSMQLEELVDDQRFCTNHARVENRRELIDILQEKLLQKCRDEWCAIFEEFGLSFAPVNDLPKVFADPHLKTHSHIVQNVEHLTAGEIQMLGLPVEYSKDTEVNQIRSAPPVLGQHTSEILREYLGFNESDIQLLYDQGVI